MRKDSGYELVGSHPGVSGTTFEIVLSVPFGARDILDELIVLNSPEKNSEGFYRTKVEQLEVFLHNQFLYKYSQFLHYNF